MSVYDEETQKWFNLHPNAETTVCMCYVCGLFYKDILGHECEGDKNDKRDKGNSNR